MPQRSPTRTQWKLSKSSWLASCPFGYPRSATSPTLSVRTVARIQHSESQGLQKAKDGGDQHAARALAKFRTHIPAFQVADRARGCTWGSRMFRRDTTDIRTLL